MRHKRYFSLTQYVLKIAKDFLICEKYTYSSDVATLETLTIYIIIFN